MVTEHIRKKIVYSGKDAKRSVLNIVRSIHGQSLVLFNDQYFRCFQFIDGASTYDVISSYSMFSEVGRVVGEFQNYLADFFPLALDDTIKHFHDTPFRYQHFLKTSLSSTRSPLATAEINFIKKRKNLLSLIIDKLNSGLLPYRVCHNDTKPSNVMIDDKTKKALCLIDFDTVMKGSLLFDYGDALRLGASTAAEDEKDLSKVHIRLDFVEAFSSSFLSQVKNIITKQEVASLYDAYLIMTLECAMRFLDDFLDFDKYFNTSYPDHNLIRAKNQIALVSEIEDLKPQIITTLNQVLTRLNFDPLFLLPLDPPSSLNPNHWKQNLNIIEG